VADGSDWPTFSYAPPPIGASLKVNDRPVRLPIAVSACTACGVTSWPTPSPGNTAIR
jgi:hypothetical protein